MLLPALRTVPFRPSYPTLPGWYSGAGCWKQLSAAVHNSTRSRSSSRLSSTSSIGWGTTAFFCCSCITAATQFHPVPTTRAFSVTGSQWCGRNIFSWWQRAIFSDGGGREQGRKNAEAGVGRAPSSAAVKGKVRPPRLCLCRNAADRCRPQACPALSIWSSHAHMPRHARGYKLANDAHDTSAIQAYPGHRKIPNTTFYFATSALFVCFCLI
jgi:hypothetical protein